MFLRSGSPQTFICCRNIQISTSSAVRDRNRSATIQTMSLTRSFLCRWLRFCAVCNIARRIGYFEEDDDLPASFALESATVFRHWLDAYRAQWCHGSGECLKLPAVQPRPEGLSPMEPGSAREADRGSSHVEKSFGGNYLMCQYFALSPRRTRICTC